MMLNQLAFVLPCCLAPLVPIVVGGMEGSMQEVM